MATRVTATVRRYAPRSSEPFLEETSASFNKLSDGDAAARLNETLARIDLDLDAASRRRHLARFHVGYLLWLGLLTSGTVLLVLSAPTILLFSCGSSYSETARNVTLTGAKLPF